MKGWCRSALSSSCGGLPRLPDRVRCGAVVQDLRGQISSVRPRDGPDLEVDSHPPEVRGIAERGKDTVLPAQMRQVHVADQAVGEREPEPVVAEDFHVTASWSEVTTTPFYASGGIGSGG
jgi:hypothetical protein